MSEPQSLHLGKGEVITLPLSTPVISRRTVLPDAPFAVIRWVLRAVPLRPTAEQTASWYMWTAAGEDIGHLFTARLSLAFWYKQGANSKGGWRSVNSDPTSSSHNEIIPSWFLRGSSGGWSPRCPQQQPTHECTSYWLFSLPFLISSTPSLVLLWITSQINHLCPNTCLRVCIWGTETKLLL